MSEERINPEILKELEFVNWSRYTVLENITSVYGWIDREKDEYKDFVLLIFNDKGVIEYHTSSAKYDELINDILGFNNTTECKRVENAFPNLDNIIELEDRSANAF